MSTKDELLLFNLYTTLKIYSNFKLHQVIIIREKIQNGKNLQTFLDCLCYFSPLQFFNRCHWFWVIYEYFTKQKHIAYYLQFFLTI